MFRTMQVGLLFTKLLKAPTSRLCSFFSTRLVTYSCTYMAGSIQDYLTEKQIQHFPSSTIINNPRERQQTFQTGRATPPSTPRSLATARCPQKNKKSCKTTRRKNIKSCPHDNYCPQKKQQQQKVSVVHNRTPWQ